MKLFFILGNQLFPSKYLDRFKKDHLFFMAEDYQLCTYEKHHKQKILLFLSSMRSHADSLKRDKFKLEYIKIEDKEFKDDYLKKLKRIISSKKIKEILLPIPVIPESMPASEILEFFTKEKKSVAVVVDEFGGTSGMVTIEDVIEELFGDIEDEHDNEDLIERKISDVEFLFSARLEIDYLNEQYKIGLPESDEYETLAGYIIHIHESIPQKGEKIETKDFVFNIRIVSKNKIELVHVLSKNRD